MGELERLQVEIRACRRCAEAGFPVEPGPVFAGATAAARPRVFVVGQAPGKTEHACGEPFRGPAGRRLFGWLALAGFEEARFRARHYLSALTRCYPGPARRGAGDRVPTRAEQDLCAPWLERELELLAPAVILPVGRLAIRRFLGGAAALTDQVGTLQHDATGRWLVPLPHPSGASRWLADPAHVSQLHRALRHLDRLRRRLDL